MSYKNYSRTSSGWVISTDPKAPSKQRWRAIHPHFGERFFERHDEILEYTVKHMMEQVELLNVSNFRPVTAALCLHCGGQWLVQDKRDPKLLEGTCMDCQRDSDAEKPLLFTQLLTAHPATLPKLPKNWLLR